MTNRFFDEVQGFGTSHRWQMGVLTIGSVLVIGLCVYWLSVRTVTPWEVIVQWGLILILGIALPVALVEAFVLRVFPFKVAIRFMFYAGSLSAVWFGSGIASTLLHDMLPLNDGDAPMAVMTGRFFASVGVVALFMPLTALTLGLFSAIALTARREKSPPTQRRRAQWPGPMVTSPRSGASWPSSGRAQKRRALSGYRLRESRGASTRFSMKTHGRWFAWWAFGAIVYFVALILVTTVMQAGTDWKVVRAVMADMVWEVDSFDPQMLSCPEMVRCWLAEERKAKRIWRALRLAGTNVLFIRRSEMPVPKKPYWRYNEHELKPYTTFDLRPARCFVPGDIVTGLTDWEAHAEQTARYWGVAPIAQLQMATPQESDPPSPQNTEERTLEKCRSAGISVDDPWPPER